MALGAPSREHSLRKWAPQALSDRNSAKSKTVPLWFWRTSQGAEVDLLVEHGGRFVPVEAKFSEAPDEAALKDLFALQKFYGKQCLRAGYEVSRAPHAYPLSNTLQAVPGNVND